MNDSSCSKPDKKLFEDTILPILYILVFIAGVVLNVWGMKSLLDNWKKIQIINIFILNLGLADMLYLLTHPFLIIYYLKENRWIFGDSFCKIIRFFFNLNLYGSIGFLTCISMYRYLAVVHPIKVMGRFTTTLAVVISAVVWILVGAQSLPDMFFPKHLDNRTEQCYDTTVFQDIEKYLNYSLSWTFIGFCIPFLIILGCYGHLTLVIFRLNSMTRVMKRHILKLLIFCILLFLFCYAPYHILRNLSLYSRVLRKQNICPSWNSGVFIARQASRALVSLNSALNPLVYLHVYEDMGAQIRQLLQGLRQIFSCLYKFESSSVPVAQTEQEDDRPL